MSQDSLTEFFSSLEENAYDAKHFRVEREVLEKNGFAIFGAGFHTREVTLPALLHAGLRPVCILDSDPAKQGTLLHGIPVKLSSELSSIKDTPVLLSSGAIMIMIAVCEKHGHYNWFVPGAIAHFCWTAGEIGIHSSELLARIDIRKAYEMFADDISKKIFISILNYHCTFNEELFSFQEDEVYFPETLKHNIDYRYFIDAGAYNGDTLSAWKRQIYSTCTDSCMYAAFEPSKQSHDSLCDFMNANFSARDSIKAYNIALGNQTAMLRLAAENTPSASILASCTVNDTIAGVSIIMLDSMNFDKVTCIKADVEGFELNMLKGAVDTIQMFRPALLISAYHKRYDIVDIPSFIHSLDLGYRFYIRHHWPTFGDTVCYMIPENPKGVL